MWRIPYFCCIVLTVDCFLLLETPNITVHDEDYSHFGPYQDTGAALILTPLLQRGKIATAQKLSRVTPDIEGTTSYSGYFTVNKPCKSNLFFWFFPAQRNWEDSPLILWLQGGPGGSSMYGLFDEIGPILYEGRNVKHRNISWNSDKNLLFIDQPVGTGYSFSDHGCYTKNEHEVTADLYSAIVQFYQLFPRLNKNKFFIAGESYAGHYIPALGQAIHSQNPSAKVKINLSGMLIGNGWMDSYYQQDYGDYVYQLGLIDDLAREKYYRNHKMFIASLNRKDYSTALQYSFNIGPSIVKPVSAYNYLENADPVLPTFKWEGFIKQPQIRKSIHVGNKGFQMFNDNVRNYLMGDTILSIKPMVERLLEHYPIVFFHGQLDIICAYPMAVKFFQALKWSGARDYERAPRHQWCVDNQLAGYFKSSHNLHEVMVRAAGHMVPKDQPLWASILVDSVIFSSPSDPLRRLIKCPPFHTSS